MKKTKINLLTYKTDYRKIEKYFFWLRISAVGFSILFFITIIVFFVSLQQKNSEINGLLDKKKVLLESVKDKSENEAKILYLQKKYQVLKNYLNEDARFLPYYDLLNSALGTSTESAVLKSFKINKNREVDFSVAFNNFTELTNFFGFVESEPFLKNFATLSLKNFFALNENDQNKENYELSFTGQFITINENKN